MLSNTSLVALLRCKMLIKLGNIKRAVDVLIAAGALLAGAVRYVAQLIQSWKM